VEQDLWALALGAFAGLACGFLNTAASSGSAVSLPILLMIGLDPLSANATNRVPVLMGAISATLAFHRRGVMPWRLAAQICLPVTVGAIGGAVLAELVPGRQFGLIITAAVLVALALLFTRLKQVLERVTVSELTYGAKEFLIFLGIGIWLGFIVLDGATYLLLALVLAIGLPLVQANAIKSLALVPTALVALAVFAWQGHIDWSIGAAMAVGSVVGGLLGARLATAPQARRWIFALLILVMGGELIHLVVHYLFETA